MILKKYKPRVIAGIYKNQRLSVPASARPATDRIKQSIFDTLSTHVITARVLDAYAGSGNLGIEAISRGASHSTFIEKDAKAANIIEQNIQKLKVPTAQTQIINSDVAHFLRKYNDKNAPKYDLLFADPPFHIAHLSSIDHFPLLMTNTAILIFRAPSSTPLTIPSNLKIVYQNSIGDSKIYFLTT